MPAHQGLALFLLGSPSVELDGRLVEFRLYRALALLIYLALNRQVHRRESLTTFFWPDCSPRQSHGDLRNVLWVLREVLGEECVLVHREEISLNPSTRVWVDVTCFQMHLTAVEEHAKVHHSGLLCPECIASLHHAVELYQADFLDGFTLKGSPAFDDWQNFQTEGLRLAFTSALALLAEYHAAEEDYAAMVAYSRRLVLLDPFDEKARMLLMQAYRHSGHPGTALRQYQEYAELLLRELGGSPSAEITRLYEAIKTGQSHSIGE